MALVVALVFAVVVAVVVVAIVECSGVDGLAVVAAEMVLLLLHCHLEQMDDSSCWGCFLSKHKGFESSEE
jgi:hypothetical protein